MKASDFLSKDQIALFTSRSDTRGAWEVLANWLIIIGTFSMMALWTNPVTLILGVVLLGGRQMGLAVLMHEAGHKTLFKKQQLNDVVGQWLCAYPVLGNCDAYGASHREHHRHAGTQNDPDLPNYQGYPISLSSLKRKLLRDLSGQTGLKLLGGLFAGSGRSIMMREGEKNDAALQGIAVNLCLFALLALTGNAALYGVWVVAYLFAYPLIARIRQVAEHGNVANLFDPDPRLNTRTTIPNWFEKLIFCPNQVNYHVEHHLLASVPSYRLKQLHQALTKNDFYKGYEHTNAQGYWDVLKRAVPELGQSGSAAA